MPTDRSYHVFLLEDGDEFSLITQLFVEIQPTLILTSDTLIHLSNKIKKISEENCEQITARELSRCIMGKVQEKIPSNADESKFQSIITNLLVKSARAIILFTRADDAR